MMVILLNRGFIVDERLIGRMKGGQGRKSMTLLENKFRQMHEAVREHKDSKTGRVLSTVFMKLPSKMVSGDFLGSLWD